MQKERLEKESEMPKGLSRWAGSRWLLERDAVRIARSEFTR